MRGEMTSHHVMDPSLFLCLHFTPQMWRTCQEASSVPYSSRLGPVFQGFEEDFHLFSLHSTDRHDTPPTILSFSTFTFVGNLLSPQKCPIPQPYHKPDVSDTFLSSCLRICLTLYLLRYHFMLDTSPHRIALQKPRSHAVRNP